MIPFMQSLIEEKWSLLLPRTSRGDWELTKKKRKVTSSRKKKGTVLIGPCSFVFLFCCKMGSTQSKSAQPVIFYNQSSPLQVN